ncbi:MAG: hypothetical protein ACM3S4_05285 [Burkholderiales bacterium]
MKKVAFALGYAGGILALILSLLMIFTVPVGLVTQAIEDIKYDLKNENIVAFNEIALAMREQGVADLSESSITEFARSVAKNSEVLNDEYVYVDTVEFTYELAVHGIISAILVGMSILFSLLAFIGALVTRKAPMGGGIMMLISALVLVLCAIYTETVVPMVAASLLLTAACIIAFVPEQTKAYAHARRARHLAPQIPPFPQAAPTEFQAFPPAAVQYPEQQHIQPQPQVAQGVPAAPEPLEASMTEPKPDVPFPDEEVQLFTPHTEEGETIKE